jgi:hypothetical protein
MKNFLVKSFLNREALVEDHNKNVLSLVKTTKKPLSDKYQTGVFLYNSLPLDKQYRTHLPVLVKENRLFKTKTSMKKTLLHALYASVLFTLVLTAFSKDKEESKVEEPTIYGTWQSTTSGDFYFKSGEPENTSDDNVIIEIKKTEQVFSIIQRETRKTLPGKVTNIPIMFSSRISIAL